MNSKVLVVAEHDNHRLKPATLNVITAALQLSQEIHVVVLGNQCRPVAEQASQIEKITQVHLMQADFLANPLAEEFSHALKEIAQSFSHILAPASTFGKNFLPRLAAALDVGQISDVVKIFSEDSFLRPMYAGNVLASVQAMDPIKILSIRTSAFEPAKITETKAPIQAPIQEISPPTKLGLSEFLNIEEHVSSRPELTQARIVVSGGRGLQSRENFKLLEDIADQVGGAVGASRAAVDAGFVPNDYQVGQTGKVVAPDLYIAIGISGAIQHLSGMKDSKVIVAINKDPEAPIFQIADYGLVGDLFQILPELSKELAIRKPKN